MSNSRRLTIGQNINSGESGGGSINTSNYMTILALEDGLQAKLSGNTISYSLDEGNTWTSLASNTYTPTVNSGQTIMFKGNLTPKSSSGIGTFTINKKCNLEGNCMSLLFGDNAVNNNSLSGKTYAFYKLFSGCTTIIQVSESFLPATTLGSYCYYSMFYGCTSLTSAPELPATTLDSQCYCYMFRDCTSLTSAPELPATTLVDRCYSQMFSGCTSLTSAPELPATTLTSSCYREMFRGCTSLTSAPELPATTLAIGCYNSMFIYCSKLNYIKMLATDTSASSCLNNWVYNVSSTGTFVKNPAMTSLPSGINGIPSGWTVVDDGEESGGNLITFTVAGVEYQAEEGMTWEEFINSEYNDGNFASSNNHVTYNGYSIYEQGSLIMGNYTVIASRIVENSSYIIYGSGGADD